MHNGSTPVLNRGGKDSEIQEDEVVQSHSMNAIEIQDEANLLSGQQVVDDSGKLDSINIPDISNMDKRRTGTEQSMFVMDNMHNKDAISHSNQSVPAVDEDNKTIGPSKSQ